MRKNLRRIDDLHVAVLMLASQLLFRGVNVWMVVAQLQEALKASTRVLRSLSIIAMGQAHDQATPLQPFPLPRSDELVDDTLGVVGKVAELSLPHRQ